MLLPLGKLLALAIVGGGGITAYYLTKTSDQTSFQSSYIDTNQGPNCRNPYELRLNNGGVTYHLPTKQAAEKYLKEDHGGKGKIFLKQNPECPSWSSLEK